MTWIIVAYLCAGVAVSLEIMRPSNDATRQAPMHAAVVAALIVLLWPIVAARLGWRYWRATRAKK